MRFVSSARKENKKKKKKEDTETKITTSLFVNSAIRLSIDRADKIETTKHTAALTYFENKMCTRDSTLVGARSCNQRIAGGVRARLCLDTGQVCRLITHSCACASTCARPLRPCSTVHVRDPHPVTLVFVHDYIFVLTHTHTHTHTHASKRRRVYVRGTGRECLQTSVFVYVRVWLPDVADVRLRSNVSVIVRLCYMLDRYCRWEEEGGGLELLEYTVQSSLYDI